MLATSNGHSGASIREKWGSTSRVVKDQAMLLGGGAGGAGGGVVEVPRLSVLVAMVGSVFVIRGVLWR